MSEGISALIPEYQKKVDFLGSVYTTVPAPLFVAPLNGTLVPSVGTGTFTFSRTTVATMRDFDGVVRNCYINEARFANGRRVGNLLKDANAKSADFQDGVWTASNCTINSAIQYACTGASLLSGPQATSIYTGDAANRSFTVSFTARIVAGTNTSLNYRLNSVGAGSPANQSTAVTLTSSFQRFSVTTAVASAGGTQLDFVFRYTGSIDTTRVIEVKDILIEDVTAQTSSSPSSYVSFGMGDSHGSGVDGVKWFSTTNGNTVSSGVVTEITGPSIGNTAYFSEQDKTNLVFPSETITSVNWTKNNISVALIAGSFLGGLAVINTIKALSTSDVTHSVSQPFSTLTADEDIALALFAASGTQSHVFIRVSKGAESATQFFNTTTGTVESAITSGGTITVTPGHAAIHAVKGGYWCHCIINGASVAGVHTAEFGISNADGSLTFAAANTTDVLCSISGLQVQLDHEIGEYIKTVGTTVTKTGDNLSYDILNIPGEEFAMVAECDIELPCASICDIVAVENLGAQEPGYFIGGRNTDKFEARAFDANTVNVYRARSGSIAAGHHKGGASFSRHAGQRLAAVNGIIVNNDPIDLEDSTSWTPTTFSVACNAAGTGQSDFAVSNVKIFPTLTSPQLQAVTL